MSFPRYPEYKDSGLEWLGQVPAHWRLMRLKHVLEFSTGWTPPTNDASSFEGDNRWANISDLGERVVTETAKRISDDAVASAGLKPAEAGSLLYSFKLSIGQVSFAGATMYTNEAIATFSPSDLVDLRFAYYAFPFLLEKNAAENIYGAKLLNQALIRSALLLLPPLREQIAVAGFLDHETAKIDALVAEQERLIALLKEKRQAVISHAVTKGLNPNAPMKDSGVDWLGSVPAAWTITPLRYLVHSVGQGWSPQCESYAADLNSEYGVLKVGAVNAGVFDPSENKKLPTELEPPADLAIRAGDLMISRANTRELVGSAAVADADYPRLLLCDKLYRLRFRRSSQLPKFIARYLATPAIREQIELGASGASASMLNISQSVILDLPVPVPPEDEMMTVLEFCAQAAQQTSELIVQAKGAVDLLLERRAALITAAVTGQIDVRGLAQAEAA